MVVACERWSQPEIGLYDEICDFSFLLIFTESPGFDNIMYDTSKCTLTEEAPSTSCWCPDLGGRDNKYYDHNMLTTITCACPLLVCEFVLSFCYISDHLVGIIMRIIYII